MESVSTQKREASPTNHSAAANLQRPAPTGDAGWPPIPHPPQHPPNSSRTLRPVLWGLSAQVLPSVALVVAVVAAALGQEVPPYTMIAVAMLSISIATTSTGGAVAHGARHWGAREPSSAWGGALSMWEQMRQAGAGGPRSYVDHSHVNHSYTAPPFDGVPR